MDRQDTILELMRTYLDMSDDNLNKKEIKKFLKDELKNQVSLKEEPTDHLLKGWIDNALRTDLEERLRKEFGLPKEVGKTEVIGTMKVPKPKN
jgi:hypothetical protein